MNTKKITAVIFLILVSLVSLQAEDVLSILYFDNLTESEEYAWISKGLADSLISILADISGVRVVERANIDEIIKVQKLALSGLMDENTMLEIGQLVNANILVTGSYTVINDQLQVNIKSDAYVRDKKACR